MISVIIIRDNPRNKYPRESAHDNNISVNPRKEYPRESALDPYDPRIE